MKVTVRIDGVKQVQTILHAETRKWLFWTKRSNVQIGYDAYYAIYVHEDLQAYHPVGKAKFLEDAVSSLGSSLVAQVEREILAGIPLPQAILQAATELLKYSQGIVPVKTGFLRSTGYVRQA